MRLLFVCLLFLFLGLLCMGNAEKKVKASPKELKKVPNKAIGKKQKETKKGDNVPIIFGRNVGVEKSIQFIQSKMPELIAHDMVTKSLEEKKKYVQKFPLHPPKSSPSSKPGVVYISDCNSLFTNVVGNTPSIKYVLQNNIDCTGVANPNPIGSLDTPFCSVFDGQGHTISNINMIQQQTHVGLFGATFFATIIDVTISNSVFTGEALVAPLAAVADSSCIVGVNVINTVVTATTEAGGLVAVGCDSTSLSNITISSVHVNAEGCQGGLASTFTDSSATSVNLNNIVLNTVNGSAGGAIGHSYNANLSRIKVKTLSVVLSPGSLTFPASSIGGMVAYTEETTIDSSSVNFFEISSEQAYGVGGFVGVSSTSTITAFQVSSVQFILSSPSSISQFVSGVVAISVSSHISNGKIYNVTINTLGSAISGGFGTISLSVVSNVAAKQVILNTLPGSYVVAGLVAQANLSIINDSVLFDSSLNGDNSMGGLFGYLIGSESYSCNASNVILYGNDATSSVIGGIAAYLQDSLLFESQNSGPTHPGDLFISGGSDVGGIVAFCANCTLIRCGVRRGRIQGIHTVGGVAGVVKVTENTSFYQLYSTNKVTLSATDPNGLIGGLVATVLVTNNSNAAFINSYSRATIFACQNKGGLFGFVAFNDTGSSVRLVNNYAFNVIVTANCSPFSSSDSSSKSDHKTLHSSSKTSRIPNRSSLGKKPVPQKRSKFSLIGTKRSSNLNKRISTVSKAQASTKRLNSAPINPVNHVKQLKKSPTKLSRIPSKNRVYDSYNNEYQGGYEDDQYEGYEEDSQYIGNEDVQSGGYEEGNQYTGNEDDQSEGYEESNQYSGYEDDQYGGYEENNLYGGYGGNSLYGGPSNDPTLNTTGEVIGFVELQPVVKPSSNAIYREQLRFRNVFYKRSIHPIGSNGELFNTRQLISVPHNDALYSEICNIYPSSIWDGGVLFSQIGFKDKNTCRRYEDRI